MSELLRIYEPRECDTVGMPLDWDQCRACGGEGRHPTEIGTSHERLTDCGTCEMHGSLKAAALATFADRFTQDARGASEVRCEDCGHPMSEGTWENPPHEKSGRPVLDDIAMRDLLVKPHSLDGFPAWAERHGACHYSPCDEGCRHAGPGRYEEPASLSVRKFWRNWGVSAAGGEAAQMVALDNRVEASWRSVDVRTLGWPHDLRPERLAVLCLRCWAARLSDGEA